MRISDLARDPALVPTAATKFERSMRAAFVSIRARAMLGADSTLRDSANEADIADAKVATVKAQLTTDLGLAVTAVQGVAAKVTADETANKLLSLEPTDVDPKLVAEYVRIDVLATTAKDLRKQLVQTIAWWATALDPSLLQTGKADDLHQLVDRRLRTTERMLFYVARKVGRGFDMAAIRANPAGPWDTGFKRIFEYHRLPGSFMSLCQPDATRVCQAPALAGWSAGAGMLTHAFKVAEPATSYWRLPTPPDPEGYLLVYDTNGGSAVDAVDNLFTPSTDFKKRNLLACDHVLLLLQIEALLHARRKRDPSTTWFQTLAARATPADWLRIYTPWWEGQYLGSEAEPQFFEHVRIPAADLQVGDHLIIYNHPVYDRLTTTGVFRLENSLVVQVYPKLLVQGHGILPQAPNALKTHMLGLANKYIDGARKLVELNMGAASPTGYPTIPLDGTGELVRRVEPQSSTYSQQNRKADWWVHWKTSPDKGERLICESTSQNAADKRTAAWEQQKVDFVPSWSVSAASTKPWGGFFPLWEPKLGKNGPVKSGGKISAINPVKLTDPMVSGWTWYIPNDPKERDMADVIRPKV